MVERRQNHFLIGFLAAVGSLLSGCSGVGVLQQGLVATAHHQHHSGCRDGVCDPACPVRPGSDGFYETTWRRRSTSRAVEKFDTEATTPAASPHLIVPGADEESGVPAIRSLPPVDQPPPPLSIPPDPTPLPPPTQPDAPSRSAPPDDDNIFSSREAASRASLVTSTAAAARSSSSAEQTQFTRRLAETLLTEHDGAVRARIVEEAATFATPSAEAICRGAADDPDPRVRLAGCAAWEKRGGSEAVRLLAERASRDTDFGVRLRAIRGLGELRDPLATAALARLLDDQDPAVQQRVCLALGRATGLSLGDDPLRWRQWATQPGTVQLPRWAVGKPHRPL